MTRDEIIAAFRAGGKSKKAKSPAKAAPEPSEERTRADGPSAGGVTIATREELDAWEAGGRDAFIREMREQLNRKPDA